MHNLIKKLFQKRNPRGVPADPSVQDLDIYWDPRMAKILETWGEKNVWHEILFLLANRAGKVLDIACGNGVVIQKLWAMPELEVHGCDISDFLIDQARARGIRPEALTVCDATRMPFLDNEFQYSYSIGSLEHFTEKGIDQCFSEASRVTKTASFHFMPVSRSGKNEGWMKTLQSFHNCSVDWWAAKLRCHFPKVVDLPSLWSDEISVGRWFLCFKG